jgi:hypothetical protein
LFIYAADIATVQSIIHHKAELYEQQNINIFGKKEVPENEVEIPDGTLMVKYGVCFVCLFGWFFCF